MCYCGKKSWTTMMRPCDISLAMMHVITNSNNDGAISPFFTLTYHTSTPFLKRNQGPISKPNRKFIFQTIPFILDMCIPTSQLHPLESKKSKKTIEMSEIFLFSKVSTYYFNQLPKNIICFVYKIPTCIITG